MYFYEKGKAKLYGPEWASAMKEIKGSGPRKRTKKKKHIFLSLNHMLCRSVSDHRQTLLKAIKVLNKSIK
jgi:hypothetical protein